MKFTIVQNTEGKLSKVMKSDGTKESCAHLSRGSYRIEDVTNLKDFNTYLQHLKSNEAITLGVPEIATAK